MIDYKTKYYEKLKDPRWQKKRLEIFERDKWTCQGCGSTKDTLNVHHLWYEGKDPWDAPTDALVTLCDECHTWEKELRGGLEKELLDAIRKSGSLWGDVDSLMHSILGCSRDDIRVICKLIVDWRIGDPKNG